VLAGMMLKCVARHRWPVRVAPADANAVDQVKANQSGNETHRPHDCQQILSDEISKPDGENRERSSNPSESFFSTSPCVDT
jgi:hypothetical protein